MAEVLLFHHAQGLTAGVRAFADKLRQAGHIVHVPDLYDGRTFEDLDAGVAFAQAIGFETIIEKSVSLPPQPYPIMWFTPDSRWESCLPRGLRKRERARRVHCCFTLACLWPSSVIPGRLTCPFRFMGWNPTSGSPAPIFAPPVS